MYGYVYLTTNLINGKKYIGQHKAVDFDVSYLGSGINLKKAIIKYGKQNFTVMLLEWCKTREDADKKEIYYIQFYKTRNPDFGYNITKGGQSKFFTGMTHTEQSKQKMSDKAKVRSHPPTTAGRTYYTNGIINKCLKPEDVDYWVTKGYYKGKTCPKRVPWNKGLTKDTNKILKKISNDRKQRFNDGEVIGCCGVKGNTFGFKEGQIPWNKGLKGFLKGHPNYYLGKKKNK